MSLAPEMAPNCPQDPGKCPQMKTLNALILALSIAIFGPAVQAAIVEPVDTTTAGFVGLAAQGPLDQAVMVSNYQEFITIFGGSTAGLTNPYLAPSVAGYFANGGVRLAVVRVNSSDDMTIIGADGGSPGTRTGLQALLDVDVVSFVAIPGVTTAAVQAAMIAHCHTAGDRMAILDSASPDNMDAVQAQRAAIPADESFAALYFPWIQAAPAGVSLLLPPSGFVAGSYSAHNPSQSPVGPIATATGVAYPVNDPEQSILNPQNINAIRNLSGIRIWGARTLSSNPEWRYISVRRLGFFLAESIDHGTSWSVLEPNSPALWNALEQEMDDFLDTVYRDGWLQGTTSNDAYFSQCGLGLTMTTADIDAGRTIVLFGFAPIRPAEFIVISIVHQRPEVTAVPATSGRISMPTPAPNPFNPTTNVSFALASDTRVTLLVHDLAGHLVRILMRDEPLAGGTHQRRWDGRDDTGRAVSSGVYLVRLEGAGEMRSRRISLVR